MLTSTPLGAVPSAHATAAPPASRQVTTTLAVVNRGLRLAAFAAATTRFCALLTATLLIVAFGAADIYRAPSRVDFASAS